ncbi:helix-loop-helix DNA-binding domain-containing protein [Stagonosporopsis vannaccii]|nr:helix-loop-helix DNA-binding domain-containing protein [Stagonosporopsis vannaccii]
MNYPGYPNVANPDYSPPQEMLSYTDQFGSAYLADSYTTSPEYSLDSFFDQALGPADMSPAFPKDQGQFNPSLPATGISASSTTPSNRTSSYSTSRHPSDAAPFGKLGQLSFGFSFDPLSTEPFETACVSPNSHVSSRTPSLCGDAPEKASSPTSSTLSPRNLKRESPSSPDSASEESTPKRPQRKRGRPRLDRTETISSTSSPSSKSQKTGRLPHNQVERKYREGLNAELERLRRAVPTLPQSDEAGAMGQPKPSKAMVLASAIEYIRKLETERDALRADNDRLRQAASSGQTIRNWKVEDESLQEFLTDP